MRTYDIVEHNGDRAPIQRRRVALNSDREFDDRAAELMPDPTKHYYVTAVGGNGWLLGQYRPARGANGK